MDKLELTDAKELTNQEKEVYLVNPIEEDSIYGDYNYEFGYIDDDGMKYTVMLSVNGEQVSNIYVTKEAVDYGETDNNQQIVYDE